MDYLNIVFIGIALAIDACALTIANCATYKDALNKKKEWAMPITFALFQGVMPLIGYFFGWLFKDYIAGVLDYISAGIFFLLALKIVIDIIKEKRESKKIVEVKKEQKIRKFTILVLLLQGLATSIDALVVGVTLVNGVPVYLSVIIIAGITFALVTLALLFGKLLGKVFNKYAEWVGAGILFLLAIKEFLEGILK